MKIRDKKANENKYNEDNREIKSKDENSSPFTNSEHFVNPARLETQIRINRGLGKMSTMEWRRSFFIWFVLHTVAVYWGALLFCPSLVGYSFRWLLPVFHVNPGISAGDWYLQHLIPITMIPVLLGGYLGARFVNRSAAMWAWLIPSIVIAWKLLAFNQASSVLIVSHLGAVKYYFEIQPAMPNRSNFFSVDVIRVSQQMTVTAPFLAGEAYSLGASVAAFQRRHRKALTPNEPPGDAQDIHA